MKKVLHSMFAVAALATAAQAFAASGDLPTIYGAMYYSDSWAESGRYVDKRGIYTFTPEGTPSFVSQTSPGAISVTHGGVFINGYYYYLNGSQASSQIQMTFNKLNTSTWTIEDRTAHVTPTKTIAYAMAYDYVSGTTYASSPVPNDQANPVMLRTVNLETGVFTDVAPLNGIYYGLVFDENGQLYGFHRGSSYPYAITFCKINKETGAATTVAKIGYNLKSQYSAAAYDFRSKKIYWVGTTFTYNQYYEEIYSRPILEIDPQTGSCREVGQLPSGEVFSDIYIKSSHPKAAAPAECEFVFSGTGRERGAVTFTVPTKTYDNNTLTGTVRAVLSVDGMVSPNQLQNLTPGSKASFAEMSLTKGSHKFSVTLYNDYGASISSDFEVFAGEDTPAAVTDVKFETTPRGDQVTVSWTAPKVGAMGGYIDEANLRYKVIRRPERFTIYTDLAETTFTDTPERPMVYSQYEIIAYTPNGGESSPAYSSPLLVGQAYKPTYLETFDNRSAFLTYTIIDNGDGSEMGNTFLYYPEYREAVWWVDYSGYASADDWFITPTIELSSDNVYRFSFDTHGYSSPNQQWTRLTAYAGALPTVEAMKTYILTEEWTVDKSLRRPNALFIPAEGDCRIGIHAQNNSRDHIAIDNVRVAVYGPSTIPGECTNVKATKKDGIVTVYATMPDKTAAGKSLGNITRALLCRATDNTIVTTVANPEKGKEIALVDNNPVFGENYYFLVAENADGAGLESNVSINVKPDVPQNPESVKVVLSNQGCDATITWKYPSNMLGANGEELSAKDITYTVSRTVNSETSIVATDLTEARVTDTNVDRYITGRQTKVTYTVTAVTLGGSSSGVKVESLMGKSFELPIEESWVPGGDFNPWSSANGNWASWTRPSRGYDPMTDPVDNDYALLSFCAHPGSAGSSGSCDYVSPCINLSGMTKPELKFYMFQSNDPNVENTTLSVGVIVVGENGPEPVEYIGTPYRVKAETSGWKEITVSLDDFATAERASIVFHGVGNNRKGSLHIDKMTITGQRIENDVRMVSLNGASRPVMGRENIYTATVENNGVQDAAGVKVELLRGDEVLDTKTIDLVSGEIKEVELAYTPSLSEDPEVEYLLTARATAAVDLKPSNNEASIPVKPAVPVLPYITDLQGQGRDGNAYLSWGEAVEYPSSIAVRDNIEDYTDFLIEGFGGWTTVDVDKSTTLTGIGSSLGTFTWTNCGVPQAWIVFNPGVVGVKGLATARSGEKCLVSITAAQRNDDWLISPLLCGLKQTISFYARAMHEAYNQEQFEIWTSTSGNNVEDFTRMGSTVTVSSASWNMYTYDLPVGTRYFAIRCVSDHQYGLMIDDIEYSPAQEPVELWGYNVYRDGERIATEIGENSYVDVDPEVPATYSVSAVYDKGESLLSDGVLIKTTGIDGVSADNVLISAADGCIIVKGAQGARLEVFTTDGRMLYGFTAAAVEQLPVETGIYMVKAAGVVSKVIVK